MMHDLLSCTARWHCAADFADELLNRVAGNSSWTLLLETNAEIERREARWQRANSNVVELRPFTVTAN